MGLGSILQELKTEGVLALYHDYRSGRLVDYSGNGNDGVSNNVVFNGFGALYKSLDSSIVVANSAALESASGTIVAGLHNPRTTGFNIISKDTGARLGYTAKGSILDTPCRAVYWNGYWWTTTFLGVSYYGKILKLVGSTWTAVTVHGNAYAPYSIHVFNGDLWVGDTGGGNVWSSTDGVVWTDRGTSASNITALATHAGELYAARWTYVWKWVSGTTWTQVGAGTALGAAPVYALCSHNGELYAGGNFNRVYKFDGAAWASVGANAPSASGVRSLISFDGYLWAGGITEASPARWNGASWDTYAGGGGGNDDYQLMEVGAKLTTARGDALWQFDGVTWNSLGAYAAGGLTYCAATDGVSVLVGNDALNFYLWSSASGKQVNWLYTSSGTKLVLEDTAASDPYFVVAVSGLKTRSISYQSGARPLGYTDGVYIGQYTNNYTPTAQPTAPLTIGNYATGSATGSIGMVYKYLVFVSRVLTATEHSKVYAQLENTTWDTKGLVPGPMLA
jgi:hypothetical protein